MKVIEDEPDAVVVVIFPDNAFKYSTSFEKHFPEFRGAPSAGQAAEPTAKEKLLVDLVANSRNEHNTWEHDQLVAAQQGDGAGPIVVDVRSPEAYAKQHISGAVNIPLAELAARQGELPAHREAPFVTVCFRGNMSISGMLVLQSLGYSNVRSLNGGTIGWAELGLPTG